MTIIDSLRSLSLYPVNKLTIQNIAEECELNGEETLDSETRTSAAFKKAKAKVFIYLSEAPQVTEAGATYNFTEYERKQLRAKANAIFEEIGEEDADSGFEVGYIGTEL